jgi:hypothetical protein
VSKKNFSKIGMSILKIAYENKDEILGLLKTINEKFMNETEEPNKKAITKKIDRIIDITKNTNLTKEQENNIKEITKETVKIKKIMESGRNESMLPK